MNMAPILPGGSTSDFDGAMALIKLIQDPIAHQKRIEELQAQANLASQMMDAVRAERRKIDTDLSVAEQDLAKTRAEREAIFSDIATKQAELKNREAAVADIATKNAALKEREDAVTYKEVHSKEREDAVARREVQITESEKDYTDKVNAANNNLVKRSKDLDERAAKLADDEAKAATREQEAIVVKQKLDRHLAAISAALSTPT